MIIQIKPLEWRDHRGHTFPDTWTALTPCGVFEIEERSAGDSPAYFATGPMYAFIADKDSLEEAKAAAQADYERRIRASLTATASAEPVAWQPIETAPRDDETFLVWFPESKCIGYGYFVPEGYGYPESFRFFFFDVEEAEEEETPTLWRPVRASNGLRESSWA